MKPGTLYWMSTSPAGKRCRTAGIPYYCQGCSRMCFFVLVHSKAQRPVSKPHVESLLVSINSLLSSSRPNESISEELAEMIGFEEIELALEILNERAALSQEVMPDHRFRTYVLIIFSRFHNSLQRDHLP